MLFFPLFIRLAVGGIGESQSASLVPTRPSIRSRNLPDLRDAPWLTDWRSAESLHSRLEFIEPLFHRTQLSPKDRVAAASQNPDVVGFEPLECALKLRTQRQPRYPPRPFGKTASPRSRRQPQCWPAPPQSAPYQTQFRCAFLPCHKRFWHSSADHLGAFTTQ
jgi:hypothetical protein